MKLMNEYKIKEIFYSIQGEGFWTGTPAVFIRFVGCNLQCSFCDTDYKGEKKYLLSEIMAFLKNFPSKHIVLTGGEPLLQVDMLLINALLEAGKFIQIETNGTLVEPFIDSARVWFTVSPKVSWCRRSGGELKVVYIGQELTQYYDSSFSHYFLQPCSMTNIEEVVSICTKNPKWRLSLQTQKMLNIR